MSPKEEDEIIADIRYRLKGEFMSEKYLPHFPDRIAEQMFICGLNPWCYRYWDSKILHHKKSSRVEFVVEALVKKEFREYLPVHRFHFFVSCLHHRETRKVKFSEIRKTMERSEPIPNQSAQGNPCNPPGNPRIT